MRSEQKLRSSIIDLTAWTDALNALDTELKTARIFPVKQRQERSHSQRSRIPYYREDIEADNDDISSHSDAKRILAPQAEIMYGGAGEVIDCLSGMDRILYEAQDFITRGGFQPNLFKIRDEIGTLRTTIKRKNKSGKLVPVSFLDPNAGGMDIDAKGLFDPKTDLVDMVNKYGHSKWSELKRDQRTNEYQHDMWQTHAPSLLVYLADIIPDHPMDAASPVLLEPGGQIAQIFIPEYDARAIVLLHGSVKMYTVDEGNVAERLLEDYSAVVEVDGPCHLILEVDEDEIEDALLVIGKPIINSEELNAINDMHLRIMGTPHYVAKGLERTDEIPDEDLEADSESDEEEDSSEEFGIRVFSGHVGVLPDINDLGSEIPSDWEEQVRLYQKETASTISLAQWRVRRKLKKLDDELSVRLDSAYLGRGYVPPGPRWDKIVEEEPSVSTDAAEKRAEMAEALFRTAKSIDNPQKMQKFRERIYKLNQADKTLVNLWSPEKGLETAKRRFIGRLSGERVKRIRCNICGTTFTSAPKYQTYHSAYRYALGHEEASLRERIDQAKEEKHTLLAQQLEKELNDLLTVPTHHIKCWKKHDKTAEHMMGDNLYTILSDDPLTAVCIHGKIGKDGKPSVENILRKKVWHWFEQRRKTTSAQTKYRLQCPHCGRLHDRTCTREDLKRVQCPACDKEGKFKIVLSAQLTKSEFQDDSHWWKDRTEAFRNLNATRTQWNMIYKQLWIQQDRIQQCYLMQAANGDNKPPLHKRKEAWKNDRDLMWDALKTAFKAQTTLAELDAFEKSLLKQVIATQLSDGEKAELTKEGKPIPQPGDILQRSPFDKLTFGDELKIRIAIENRRAKIAKDRKASVSLALYQTDTFTPSIICCEAENCEHECLGKENLEAWCYRCNRPSIGRPKFGTIEENEGYLYIECTTEDCHSKIAIGAHNGYRNCREVCKKA